MRFVTQCPACETQFYVTEAQLSKHDGKVRCGQCLHVFNAKAESNPTAETSHDTPSPSPAPQAAGNTWPTLDAHFASSLQETKHSAEDLDAAIVEKVEVSVSEDEIAAFAKETLLSQSRKEAALRAVSDAEKQLNEITKLNLLANEFSTQNNAHTDYFADLLEGKQQASQKLAPKARGWLWSMGALVLLLVALLQSIYFMRGTISAHYPQLLPYLSASCAKLGCSVQLPKEIALIQIDDSDMHEDLQYAGVMQLSSTLINKAHFQQAYPNLELTLTDAEDTPLLRRIFKPEEYLPKPQNITAGFAPNEEVKVKLAITTQDIAAAGYRVQVTYDERELMGIL